MLPVSQRQNDDPPYTDRAVLIPAKAPEEAEVAIATMPKGKAAAAAAAAKCKPLSAYFGTKRKSPDDEKKETILLSRHQSPRFNVLSRRGPGRKGRRTIRSSMIRHPPQPGLSSRCIMSATIAKLCVTRTSAK